MKNERYGHFVPIIRDAYIKTVNADNGTLNRSFDKLFSIYNSYQTNT